jgi:hypothetical protein
MDKQPYKLHLKKLNQSNDDFKEYFFKKHDEMIDFIDANGFQKTYDIVWLTYRIIEKNDIRFLITENNLWLQNYLQSIDLNRCVGDFYLLEFNDYQEAFNYTKLLIKDNNIYLRKLIQ